MISTNRLLFLLIYSTIVAFLSIILFGCAISPKKETPIITSDSVREPIQALRIKNEGSLWQDDGALSELFIDPKARRVGDIVTINIVESSKATNEATTKTGRESSLSGSIKGLFNLEKKYPSDQPFFNPFSKVEASLKSDFDGSGATKRSGKLTARISARIIRVLPNGNFVIAGSREVAVNNESQIITLSGIIRPRDISPDNVVLSTYICDARITYSGAGIVNDRQRPGWLARVLDFVWPF